MDKKYWICEIHGSLIDEEINVDDTCIHCGKWCVQTSYREKVDKNLGYGENGQMIYI